MYFMFRGRIIEFKTTHVVFSVLLLLKIILSILSYFYFKEFLIFALIGLFVVLIAFISFLLISNFILYEISYFFKNRLKYIISSIIILSLISLIIIFPINLPKIDLSLNSINFDFLSKTKQPSIESPTNLGDSSNIDNQIPVISTTTTTIIIEEGIPDEPYEFVPITTTTIPITTTTITTTTTIPKTTTTTSTTTTTKKIEKTGFFLYKKDPVVEDEPQDCSFNGKGQDAVLMPSGNYYCRSTQQRITIYIDGVEKICCVVP